MKNPFLLSFDEINGFVRTSIDGSNTLDEFITSVEGLLVQTYNEAVEGLNEELHSDYGIDYMLMHEIINRKIEDMDYKDRIREHGKQSDSIGRLVNLVESEYVRVTNETRHLTIDRFETDGQAKKEKWNRTKDNLIRKTWQTMRDDKVRDTHDYLENRTIPFNERFFTYDGDSAQYPHGFSKAENNVNCRCWVTYTQPGKA